MTPTAGASATSSPPDHPPGSPAPADQVVWRRVEGIGRAPLHLMTARIGRRHYAPHAHEEYAIGVTVAGVETMVYRGERIRSGPGDLVIVEPGETHTGGPAGDDGFTYRVFYPSVELLAEGSRTVPHFRDAVLTDPQVSGALRAAHLALSTPGDPLEGESRLLWALAALVGRHAEAAARPVGPPGRGAHVARAVTARLADAVTDPPTLHDLAADLGMSRYQVLRAFREATGMTPYAWLAQHRVARARSLLDAGRRPAEAAALVGFADQAHLTRWFRRVMGVTPGVYRNGVQDGAVLLRRH